MFFSNLRSWCVANRNLCRLIFMDDKAKIPVGNPGTPEAATCHNRKAWTRKEVVLESSDHNYHNSTITPSVDLICDIPESPSESFYRGQIYVGIKDSVFQPSDPLRHIVELLKVIREGIEELPPFLTLFTDGGGDHNITFLFVQCMLLALFTIGDFDILNVGRCAPHQSYINPAERCMSLLNIGLQGLALQRDNAGTFESVLKSCSTMKSLRDKAISQQGTEEALLSSTEAPRRILHDVFSLLELKGKPVKMFQESRDDTEIITALCSIESKITSEADIPHSIAKLPSYPGLHSYMGKHMVEGLYLLQFRKCANKECCQFRSNDTLQPLVPAPVLGPSGESYLKFTDTYGMIKTTEKDCPSLKAMREGGRKKLAPGIKYIASRVVTIVKCCQCNKPRCIYSLTAGTLTSQGQQDIENIMFSCGMVLNSKTLYAAGHIKCNSLIEVSYYNCKLRKGLICTHCGTDYFMKERY